MRISIKSDILGELEDLDDRSILANSHKGSQHAMGEPPNRTHRIAIINGSAEPSVIHDLLRRYGTIPRHAQIIDYQTNGIDRRPRRTRNAK